MIGVRDLSDERIVPSTAFAGGESALAVTMEVISPPERWQSEPKHQTSNPAGDRLDIRSDRFENRSEKSESDAQSQKSISVSDSVSELPNINDSTVDVNIS